MRALILVTASLAISACGTKDGTENAVTTSDNLAAEAIIANDTTAIDAATGDAANMAADVDYSVNILANEGDGSSAGERTTSRQRPSERPTDSDNDSDAADETAVDVNGA